MTQFGGNNVVTGTGASGVGIPRVTVSNDSVVGLATGANTIGKVDILGNAGATLDAAPGATAPTNAVQVAGVDQDGQDSRSIHGYSTDCTRTVGASANCLLLFKLQVEIRHPELQWQLLSRIT